ncbi:uncharacterized protein PGTG_10358 [Puccinia graminis f. sp. tritici CRL 75-36-700-3]|uniref:Uncharacterized protein n=1 Tax=Puccinia graminis f. sp. tritici (strain CRL 75-36-700-3 / race SCCL) TaxID=418459 RepID=E3KKR2_PUCGT|nr:uncharacterized protein PGTG_10358 [Puccinia graminis f. sp. tritici CRL 75-36-700-3]EFP84887.2 hypothetical protein PGTG_10358 [Puccinia graminis f. sp. tritici CRL 75-36-700-3]
MTYSSFYYLSFLPAQGLAFASTVTTYIACYFRLPTPQDNLNTVPPSTSLASTTNTLARIRRTSSQLSPVVLPSNRLCPLPMARKSSRKSQATQAKDIDTERARFEILHADHKDAAELFDDLLETAGLEKVREHNNQLDRVFQLLKLDQRDQGRVTMLWKDFTSGRQGGFAHLQERLKLTDEADQDKITTLIRCAHFVRFPSLNPSGLSNEEMLAATEGTTPPTKKKELSGADKAAWSTAIVQKGFGAEYKGHDLIVLPTLKTLREFAGLWQQNKYKAPYTSIVGPTMSGKTRLLKELAAHVCVVYICLRDQKSTGQPPRSKIASYFFPPEPPDSGLLDHYTHLLAAILNTVSKFFSRPDILQKDFKARLTEWFGYSFQMDSTLKNEYNADVENELKQLRESPSTPAESLIAAVKKVSKRLQYKEDGGLRVLLAIDEASNLIYPIDTQLEISYFHVLCRALSEIPSSNGVFGLFTDTTSRVANFNPALSRDNSARHHGLGYQLFAPIYQISSFDVFVPKAPPSSWNELLSPERLFSYGCPFYGLYFKEIVKERPETAVETTSLIAETKLLLDSPSASSELSESQCFAILGSLIQTRLTLHSPINSELVASHAAHCMFIDSNRELIVSEYPPQFVYASAANRVLASNETHWIKCINVLTSAVQKGLVALGDAGEMATRIILIHAMQKTEAIPCDTTDMIPNGYSVRLKDFLHTLSGKDPREMEFGYKDNKTQPLGKDNKTQLLEKGRIFFNHFTRISYTPSAADFLELLYRGVAVQCKSRQPGLDDLFPIYLAPPTSESPELNRRNITFCGVQTKNQAGYVDWKQSPNWSKSYANIEGIENPYLILLFSLRTASRSVTPWTNPTSNDTGRVSYQFLGLDEINCLTPNIRSALERLITAIPDDLLKLHNQPAEVTKQWLKQLHPVFYPRAPEQLTPGVPAASQQQRKRPKTGSKGKKKPRSQGASKRT